MSNQAPGLSEYEKSILLTQAQESFIIDIYTGKYNKDSFEGTEEVTSYLNTLVKDVNITSTVNGEGITKYSKFYQLPDDLWYITYESVILNDSNLGCKDGCIAIVKPTTQDEIYSINRNPFMQGVFPYTRNFFTADAAYPRFFRPSAGRADPRAVPRPARRRARRRPAPRAQSRPARRRRFRPRG